MRIPGLASRSPTLLLQDDTPTSSAGERCGPPSAWEMYFPSPQVWGLLQPMGYQPMWWEQRLYPVLPLLLCLVPCSCDRPWEAQDHHWLKENVEIHGIDQNPAWNPEPGPGNLKPSCQDNHRWEGKCLLKAPVFWGWWWFAMQHYLSNGWLIHHLTLWAKHQGIAFWFEWPLSGCRFCVLHCSLRFPDERLWICSLLVWLNTCGLILMVDHAHWI